MNLTVICPFHRVENARNVLENWQRRTFRGARLVVVLNGSGRLVEFPSGITTIESAAHQSHAKNAGLEHALKDGWSTHWTTFDDDDYYGPKYLQEVADAFAAGHEVVGKSESWVSLHDGRLMLFGNDGASRVVPGLQGPTIGSVLWPDMPRFSARDRWGEDFEWTEDAKKLGKQCWATSRNHFCYVRRAPQQHTFPLTDEELLAFSRGDVFHVKNPGLDVVDGLDAPALTQIERPKLPATQHPLFRGSP